MMTQSTDEGHKMLLKALGNKWRKWILSSELKFVFIITVKPIGGADSTVSVVMATVKQTDLTES